MMDGASALGARYARAARQSAVELLQQSMAKAKAIFKAQVGAQRFGCTNAASDLAWISALCRLLVNCADGCRGPPRDTASVPFKLPVSESALLGQTLLA